MSVLDQICDSKWDHIKRKKGEISISELESLIKERSPTYGFINEIRENSKGGDIALIAEVKKASPSKGVIRDDFDPVVIARSYEGAGATCLSVLTDTPYFQGQDSDLNAVRAAVGLPLLRKDFMLDPYQIAESRALGADCVLLIAAALTPAQMEELSAAASSYGLDTLVEIHNKAELESALNIAPAMIGVNNRDLKTLKVDIGTCLELAGEIPAECLKIAESGIGTFEQVRMLKEKKFDGILVGESLLRQPDIAQAARALLDPAGAGKDALTG